MFDSRSLRRKLNAFIPGEATRSTLQNVLTVEWDTHKTVLVEVPQAGTGFGGRRDGEDGEHELEGLGGSGGGRGGQYGRLEDEDEDYASSRDRRRRADTLPRSDDYHSSSGFSRPPPIPHRPTSHQLEAAHAPSYGYPSRSYSYPQPQTRGGYDSPLSLNDANPFESEEDYAHPLDLASADGDFLQPGQSSRQRHSPAILSSDQDYLSPRPPYDRNVSSSSSWASFGSGAGSGSQASLGMGEGGRRGKATNPWSKPVEGEELDHVDTLDGLYSRTHSALAFRETASPTSSSRGERSSANTGGLEEDPFK